MADTALGATGRTRLLGAMGDAGRGPAGPGAGVRARGGAVAPAEERARRAAGRAGGAGGEPAAGRGEAPAVVGVVGLVTIGLAATWWIGVMADNATEVSDRLPDPPATTDAPAIEAPEPTTTTTTRSTGTTIPHLDGWETLVVGEDIQPGIITSDADLDYCGWSRVITVDDGRSAEGLANGGGPRPVVEVKPTDLLAHSCGPWEAYVPADTPATTMGDGDWLVGADVAPGRYRTSSNNPDCYWERGRDFTRDPATHLENNGGDGRTVVDLVDGERFTTYQCGTWVRD